MRKIVSFHVGRNDSTRMRVPTKEGITMTKNEFIAKRLHDEARVRRVSIPILIGCVAAAVVMSVFGLATGKGVMSVGPALIMASIALRIPVMINERKEYEAAERELVAHAADPATALSASTRALIDHFERRSASELKQQTIAYLLMGIMLLGLGIFLFVLLNSGDFRENNVFLELVLPVIMAGGGLFVCFLGINAWRGYKMARDLQSFEI